MVAAKAKRAEQIMIADLDGGARRFPARQPFLQFDSDLVETRGVGSIFQRRIARPCQYPARRLQIKAISARCAKTIESLPRLTFTEVTQNLPRRLPGHGMRVFLYRFEKR